MDLPPALPSTPYAPGGALVRTVRATGAGGDVPLVRIEIPTGSPLWQVAPTYPGTGVGSRQTVGATVAQRAPVGAYTAAINGDLFSLVSGDPSGVLVTGGKLLSEAVTFRSSAVSVAGQVGVGSVGFDGTFQGAQVGNRARTLDGVNRPARADRAETVLFTEDWGPFAPVPANGSALAVTGVGALGPNAQVAATATGALTEGTGLAIPAGGGVLVGTGDRRVGIRNTAVAGNPVAITVASPGLAPDAEWAIGGGPLLVRASQPVTSSGEGFTAAQMIARSARSAIGRSSRGRTVMLVADGGRSGFASGLTNAEFAQAVAAEGLTDAMGLDGGGSAELDLGGAPANVPTDGRPRAVSSILLATYLGAWLPRSSTTSVVRPGYPGPEGSATYAPNAPFAGTMRFTVRRRGAGGDVVLTREIPFDAQSPRPTVAWNGTDERTGGLARNGAYVATAAFTPTDPAQRPTSAAQRLALVNVLGAATRVGPTALTVRARKAGAPARNAGTVGVRATLAVRAKVTATVVDSRGRTVTTLGRAARRIGAGTATFRWDGRDARRRAVAGGRYTIVVAAKSGTLPVVTSAATVAIRLRTP